MYTDLTLLDALTLAKPHMSTDDTLSPLCYMKVNDGNVIATDRYTLVSVNFATDDENVSAANGYYSLQDFKVLAAGGSVTPLSLEDADFDYPKIERLFDNPRHADAANDAAEPIDKIAFSPKLLQKFAPANLPKSIRASDRAQMAIHFEFGATNRKPVLITYPGLPTYRALLVPARILENR